MDFDINIEMGSDSTPETEIRLQLDTFVIRQIHEKIKEIKKRYGPERSVGPVTFILRHNESVVVLIGTQKQGDVECYLNEFSVLVEGIPDGS